MGAMWQIIRPMLPMVVILAIPIVPFLLFGEQLEASLQQWREHPPAKHWVALAVIALLASDIFLPVPSSVVCAIAGNQLGAVAGTLVTWLGMNLGAVLGFALAKQWGPAMVRWFSRDSDLQRAGAMAERFGPPLLAVARGVPGRGDRPMDGAAGSVVASISAAGNPQQPGVGIGLLHRWRQGRPGHRVGRIGGNSGGFGHCGEKMAKWGRLEACATSNRLVASNPARLI